MDTISPEVKTALVTGTDHGVGFSLAKKLLSRGYFVIAVRVDETEKQIDALAYGSFVYSSGEVRRASSFIGCCASLG